MMSILLTNAENSGRFQGCSAARPPNLRFGGEDPLEGRGKDIMFKWLLRYLKPALGLAAVQDLVLYILGLQHPEKGRCVIVHTDHGRGLPPAARGQ